MTKSNRKKFWNRGNELIANLQSLNAFFQNDISSYEIEEWVQLTRDFEASFGRWAGEAADILQERDDNE